MKELYTSFRKSRWFPLITSIVSIFLGIVCLMNSQLQMKKLAMYAGVGFLIYGACRMFAALLIKDNKKQKILNAVIGIVVILLSILDFVNLDLVGKYIPVLAGFVMIVCGITNVFRSLVLLKS